MDFFAGIVKRLQTQVMTPLQLRAFLLIENQRSYIYLAQLYFPVEDLSIQAPKEERKFVIAHQAQGWIRMSGRGLPCVGRRRKRDQQSEYRCDEPGRHLGTRSILGRGSLGNHCPRDQKADSTLVSTFTSGWLPPHCIDQLCGVTEDRVMLQRTAFLIRLTPSTLLLVADGTAFGD